jgi:amino acid permease
MPSVRKLFCNCALPSAQNSFIAKIIILIVFFINFFFSFKFYYHWKVKLLDHRELRKDEQDKQENDISDAA